MDSPTPFDADAPLGSRRAIIRRNPEDVEEVEMVEAVWGSDPRFSDGVNYRFVRAENKAFPTNRCLIAASEFHMKVDGRRYKVTLDSGNFFYLAGIWEPGLDDALPWYRIITVFANPEVERYQERHGAIIQRHDVMKWLDGTVPAAEMLVTPPKHFFFVEDMGRRHKQSALSF